MPKTAARSRRSVATFMSTAVLSASVAVLLLPVTAPPAGAAAAPGSTERASVGNPNTESQTGGRTSMLSGNGQSVAFTSRSKLDNLDLGTGSSAVYEQVFVRDLVKGRTVMISRGQFTRPQSSGTPGGGVGIVRYGPDKQLELGAPALAAAQAPEIKDTPPTGESFSPSISADGRFVAFSTNMRNLFLEDNDRDSEIVIADRDPDADGNYDEDKPNGSRDYKYYRVTNDERFLSPGLPKLAANASRIAWVQGSGDGASNVMTASLNLAGGQIGATERVPGDLGGGPNDSSILVDASDPAISGEGNHIVFHGIYQPRCDCNNFQAIVSTDMRSKESTQVDFDNGKPVSSEFTDFVMHPAVNNNGTVIAFVGEVFEFAIEGPAFSKFNEPNVYVVNVDYSKPRPQRVVRTQIASRDNAFNLINGERPALSSDGRYLAFVTDNLRAHDGNDGQTTTGGTCIKPPPPQVPRMAKEPLLRLNAAALPAQRNAPRTTCQVVVRDLIVDRERLVNEQSRMPGTLVSPNRDGNAGNNNTVPSRNISSAPSFSTDATRIGYDSDATDLVPPDNNRSTDAFVRTLQPNVRGNAVDFGDVQIGDTSTETAQLTETGFGPLTVEQVSIIGADEEDFAIGGQTCVGQTIHATGGCQVSIQFKPTAVGERKAQLLVVVRGNRRATVDLAGRGTEAPPEPVGPLFAATPNPISFGNRLLLSNGPTSAVTITNGGDRPLQISETIVVGPGNPEDYKIASSTCNALVQPGGQCTVAVAFSPRGSGNRNAVLRFTDTAPGGPHLVGLTGSANQPTIEVRPGVTPPGRVVMVTGKQFPPNKAVTVKFLDRPGQTVITTKDDGTFSAQLLVFHKATPETRSIVATMPEFADPLARTPLLIVFPTVSPADFVVRG